MNITNLVASDWTCLLSVRRDCVRWSANDAFEMLSISLLKVLRLKTKIAAKEKKGFKREQLAMTSVLALFS